MRINPTGRPVEVHTSSNIAHSYDSLGNSARDGLVLSSKVKRRRFVDNYMGRKPRESSVIPLGRIERSILSIRGHRVMLDVDLAELYVVETKSLNRAISRNRSRFPSDFIFQLTPREFGNLRFHFGTSRSWGGRRYRPYVFTQEGVAMLSSTLRSARAVAVNIEIMRVFVRLRQLLETHADLAHRLNELEKRYDKQFRVVFEAIRELMTLPVEPPKPPIGFQSEKK
jgi:hypothetical protein